ncbi:transient receptor potential channel pyrexia-like [Macrosteles quadrilineatus]|uniref:transient receptor potential channel pyrexia-like n=1 Tax=Macrosteles quadrilineatus TaxID=74068 RepID=UPI0023E2FE51|nr:transient receptor potential channel pyrexia-like [Macrosteles quadrilineatus]
MVNYSNTDRNEIEFSSTVLRSRIIDLSRAIMLNDLAKVDRIIASDNFFLELVNCSLGPQRMTPLHLASSRGQSLGLVSLLVRKGAQVSATDKIGRSALHYAAARGDNEMVRFLVNAKAEVNCRLKIQHSLQPTSVCVEKLPKDLDCEYERLQILVPLPTSWGRSPLHQAVKGGHVECVKTLLDNGADVNLEDDKGLTPLLLAGAGGLARYEAIVDLLVSHGAQINKINADLNTSALYHAVALGSVRASQTLLEAGALDLSCSHTFKRAETVLHVAATGGSSTLVDLLLNFGASKYVNWPNTVGCTPLHKAAYGGFRECLILLMDKGGDISMISDGDMTVMDVIMSYIPRPINFLTDCLDSRINANNSSINDRDFEIYLDFTFLSPQDCKRQMSVVSTFTNTSEILQHPLVESFVLAKWRKLRFFFLFIVFVHLTFVISLSTYILIWVHKKEQMIGSRLVLMFSSCVLLVYAATELVMMGRQRLRQFESWLTLANCFLSLLITLCTPGGFDFSASVKEPMPYWVRHIASIVTLLSWGALMSLIGRFPSWGYYALMFSVVLQNVMKVFLTFICLVIGFALSFSVQFPQDLEFSNPWLSLVRTTVMMTGEYDYNSLFGGNKTETAGEEWPLVPTSRVIFLLFVLLASVALMNLMIGLAVSDIQGLQTEGNIRRLQKQCDFVSHLEYVLSHKVFTRYVEWLVPKFVTRHQIPTFVTVRPSTFTDFETLPTYLLERLINIALQNRSKPQKFKILEETDKEIKPVDVAHLKQLLLETMSILNSGRLQSVTSCDEMDSGRPAEDNSVSVNAMLRRVSTPKHPFIHKNFQH